MRIVLNHGEWRSIEICDSRTGFSLSDFGATKHSKTDRLNRLRKSADFVIPRADVARGISFSPGICEKADPSLRSG
jgi:hypothetical protein